MPREEHWTEFLSSNLLPYDTGAGLGSTFTIQPVVEGVQAGQRVLGLPTTLPSKGVRGGRKQHSGHMPRATTDSTLAEQAGSITQSGNGSNNSGSCDGPRPHDAYDEEGDGTVLPFARVTNLAHSFPDADPRHTSAEDVTSPGVALIG